MSLRPGFCKIRMYFSDETKKAVRLVDSPISTTVKRYIWLPKSVLEHITKLPKPIGHTFCEWDIELPCFIVEQKDLGDFEV